MCLWYDTRQHQHQTEGERARKCVIKLKIDEVEVLTLRYDKNKNETWTKKNEKVLNLDNLSILCDGVWGLTTDRIKCNIKVVLSAEFLVLLLHRSHWMVESSVYWIEHLAVTEDHRFYEVQTHMIQR